MEAQLQTSYFLDEPSTGQRSPYIVHSIWIRFLIFFFLLTHLVLQTSSSHILKRFSTYTSGLSRPPVTAAPSAATDRDREALFSRLPGLPVNAPATGNHNGGVRFSVLPTPPSPPPWTHPTHPFLLCFHKSCFPAGNRAWNSPQHEKKISGRGQVRQGYWGKGSEGKVGRRWEDGGAQWGAWCAISSSHLS